MSPEVDAAEFADLAESINAAGTPGQTAEDVVGYARYALDADHGSITLMRARGRLQTIGATDPITEQVDRLQYELDEGTCRDSSWHRQTLLVPDLATDPRWPRWGPKAAALGIASVLGVELTNTDDSRIGSINLFWVCRHDFDADDVAYANIFGRHAALALANSLEISGLNTALDARKLIGQAQGILMERHGLDDAQAFEVLKRYSQDQNTKLRVIAERLIRTRRLQDDGGMGERRLGTQEPSQRPERA